MLSSSVQQEVHSGGGILLACAVYRQSRYGGFLKYSSTASGLARLEEQLSKGRTPAIFVSTSGWQSQMDPTTHNSDASDVKVDEVAGFWGIEDMVMSMRDDCGPD